jgi:hypothetical protein
MKLVADYPEEFYYNETQLLGFRFGYNQGPLRKFGANIPLWFPTALVIVLLCWAWRKTRPPTKGRAFLVEAGSANGGTIQP